MKSTLLLAFLAGTLICNAQPQSVTKNIALLKGNWVGTLTYLDYTTGKPYTMEANLEVIQLNKSDTFLFNNSYPKEPQANNTDTVVISRNGKKWNNSELVIIKEKAPKNTINFITQEMGLDGNDNKPALIKHTYRVSQLKFDIIKEVKFSGTADWIQRNSYNYIKI